MPAPWILPWLLGAALAQDPASDGGRLTPQDWWVMVQRARFLDSLDGDPRAAVERYQDLVHNELPAGDPALSEALYWLARARWSIGEADAARDALDQCIRSGIDKARCTELRSRIDLEEESIRTVPTRWTFDNADHGVFHPRSYWDKGTIRLITDVEGSCLVWDTQVDPVKEDRLVVGFHAPQPPPRTIAFRLRSGEIRAVIEIELVDVYGHRYTTRLPTATLPVREWVRVQIDLSDTTPLDPDGPPLDPSDLYRLVLRDMTAITGATGRNELRLDDFEVR
ncbi:MAG: tetratricopeptide repeat protein [Alphaproteobacteria bacterium]|nr:tetratricopeptide repeat protein [Alphaproteobacteria bacterium]